LLLSLQEMISLQHPFPNQGLEDPRIKIIPTKQKYRKVTEKSPIFTLDCEMCMTKCGDAELTRISMVSTFLGNCDQAYKGTTRSNKLRFFRDLAQKLRKNVKNIQVWGENHPVLPCYATGLKAIQSTSIRFHPGSVPVNIFRC
jgi:hypothetical protein